MDDEDCIWKLSVKDIEDVMLGKGVQLRDQQLQAIRAILRGRDVLAKLPTGYGKSMIFQAILAAHAEKGGDRLAIIVTPLNSISFTHQRSFNELGICCLDISRLAGDFTFHGYSAIISSPEALTGDNIDKIVEEVGDRCGMFVIDEAHCIDAWGKTHEGEKHPFRQKFDDLATFIALLETRPVVLCITATMDSENELTAVRSLGLNNIERICVNPVNPLLSFINKPGCLNIQHLVNVMKDSTFPRMLIFEGSIVDCGMRYMEFRTKLEENGKQELVPLVEQYHSSTPRWKQEEIAESLMNHNGIVRIVIATSALSMGFDATGIEYVIHTRMPAQLHEFIQMTGRAGRKQNIKAYCVLFKTKRPLGLSSAWDSSSSNQYRTQNQECRRVVLSRYFEGPMQCFGNNANDTCCDFCGQSEDPLVANIVQEGDSTRKVTLPTCRRVKQHQRGWVKAGLKEVRSQIYDGKVPYFDVELTDGLIDLITLHVNKINSKDDLAIIVPGLSRDVSDEVMNIIKDIFDII